MQILYPFAKRFIAGDSLTTALPNIKTLHQKGYLSTVDVLGENVHSKGQIQGAKQEYLDLISAMESLHVQFDLSIKLTQMGLNIDYQLCKNHVVDILNEAGKHTIRFDMEGSDCTERTIQMGMDLNQEHSNLGLVLQAYLLRTQKDIESVIHHKISTRLCKGAYKEPAEIAFQQMDDIRKNFLKLAYQLLKEGHLPAIATHDEYLIKKILKFVHEEKISHDSFYFELLFGVRRDLQKALLKKGFQVRIYVPYGKSWLPYTLRRLAERKENILFVIKNLLKETFGLGKMD